MLMVSMGATWALSRPLGEEPAAGIQAIHTVSFFTGEPHTSLS
jgi:hypothetical protein